MKSQIVDKSKNRMIWLDALKGIGMILVIIGHGPNINENLWKFIWSFHMPLFFFLAGYTFRVADDTKYSKRKFRRLIIPYVFTTLLLMVIDLVKYMLNLSMDATTSGIVSICIRWIWGGIYGSCWSYDTPFHIYDIGAIWFLVTLFCAELILNEILQFKYEYLIPTIILGFGYIGMVSKQFIWLPWNIQASFVMLSVMYIGYIVHENEFLMKSWNGWHLILFPIALMCITSDSMVIVGNNSYTYGCFSIVGAIVISAYLCKLSILLFDKQNKLTNMLAFVGRNSIVVLCFHLIELDMIPWGNIDFNCVNQTINNCVIICLKIMFSLVMIGIVKKIRFLRRIFYEN